MVYHSIKIPGSLTTRQGFDYTCRRSNLSMTSCSYFSFMSAVRKELWMSDLHFGTALCIFSMRFITTFCSSVFRQYASKHVFSVYFRLSHDFFVATSS